MDFSGLVKSRRVRKGGGGAGYDAAKAHLGCKCLKNIRFYQEAEEGTGGMWETKGLSRGEGMVHTGVHERRAAGESGLAPMAGVDPGGQFAVGLRTRLPRRMKRDS